MSSDTMSTPVDVRSLLALPPIDGLSENQVRGITCVWDGIALTPATAVDLGPRRIRHLDGTQRWFPRGCHQCTQVAALRMLHEHAMVCPRCQDDYPTCSIGLGLNRLLRECR